MKRLENRVLSGAGRPAKAVAERAEVGERTVYRVRQAERMEDVAGRDEKSARRMGGPSAVGPFEDKISSCIGADASLRAIAILDRPAREALRGYAERHPLVVNELGDLAHGPDAAKGPFQVIDERALKPGPVILAANKRPTTSGSVLHHNELAEATVHRRLERGGIPRLRRRSYRDPDGKDQPPGRRPRREQESCTAPGHVERNSVPSPATSIRRRTAAPGFACRKDGLGAVPFGMLASSAGIPGTHTWDSLSIQVEGGNGVDDVRISGLWSVPRRMGRS